MAGAGGGAARPSGALGAAWAPLVPLLAVTVATAVAYLMSLAIRVLLS